MPGMPATLAVPAADVRAERLRLERQSRRMQDVIHSLQARAAHYRTHGRDVPAPLRHAIAGFRMELRNLRRRIVALDVSEP